MSRNGLPLSWLSAAALVLAVILAGCGPKEDGDASGSTPIDLKQFQTLSKPFGGWPDPKFVLVLSGDQHGYLEPCGCAERQKGGLPRRDGLVADLRKRGWSPIGLDLGSLSSGRMGRQAEIKLNTTVEALKLMDYKAVGIGAEEVRFGPGQLTYLSVDQQAPAMISANLTFADLNEYPRGLTIVEQGPWKIGVTAIYGKHAHMEAENPDILWKEPAEVLATVLEKLQDVDLRVLLAQAPREETEELLEKFPQFDLALCTGGGDAPPDEPAMVGNTMLVQVGRKGMYVGVVGFFGDAQPKLRYQLIELGEGWPESKEMKDRLQMYQDELKDQDVIGGLFDHALPTANGAQFVGATKCGECHTKAFSKWRESHHAKAFEDLKKVGHQFDPECVTCHTTGWQPQDVVPMQGGFRSEEQTPELVGNGCENCHGAGSLHVEAERGADEKNRAEWRKKMQLTADLAQKNLCATKCHDEDNSPKFTFFKYWKEIEHPGKD